MQRFALQCQLTTEPGRNIHASIDVAEVIGSITGCRSNCSCLQTSDFCFTASPSDAFKSEQPPVPRRPRLFLSERWVSRSPTFSFWQAVSFVSVPVWPLRRAVHQRSSRPAQVFPQSERDRSLPRSSMTGKFGGDADWGSWALFAFCEVGWGARRPAK